VLRPATAIIRKLVISSPQTDGKGNGKAKGRANSLETSSALPAHEELGGDRFGFDRVWKRMEQVEASVEGGKRGTEGLLGVIVKRLEGTGDLELVAQR
jgi:engulfment/cell motility protein 1